MDYKIKIISPNGIRFADPAGLNSLREKRVEASGFTAGYKKSLEGELLFTGDDFLYLDGLLESNRRFNDVKVIIYTRCSSSGNYTEKYKGFLNLRDTSAWDKGNKTIKCTISLDDPYQRYNDIKGIEYNLFSITSKRVNDIATTRITSKTFQNAVPLYDAILQMLRNGLTYASVKSDFFRWAPDNASYSIGSNSHLRNMVIFQQSDITRADISGYTPATNLPISLGKVVDDLCRMFNLKYDIDLLGNFRIEHVSWWENFYISLDLTQNQYADVRQSTENLNFSDIQIARQETFNIPKSKYRDFIGLPIEYNNAFVRDIQNIGSSDDKQISYDCQYFATDFEAIAELEPDDIGNGEGAVLVAIDNNNLIEIGNGILEFVGVGTIDRANNYLSWALLHDNFYKHNRIFEDGKMNGVNTTFSSVQKILEQKKITIPWCCTDTVDERGYIKTFYGYGRVKQMVINHFNNTLEVVLVYSLDQHTVIPAPVCVDDTYATNYNTTLNTSVSALATLISNDTGATSVEAETKTTDKGGTVQIFPTGHFIYTPPANYFGMDAFEYYAKNAAGKSDIGKCYIIVKASAIYVKGTQTDKVTPIYPGPGNVYYYTYDIRYYADPLGLVPLDVTGYNLTIKYSRNINSVITNGTLLADGFDDFLSSGIYGSPQTYIFNLTADPAYTII